MTPKDYVKFAEMFKDAKNHPEYATLSTVLYMQGRLEAILKADNPAFDIGGFSKACSNV